MINFTETDQCCFFAFTYKKNVRVANKVNVQQSDYDCVLKMIDLHGYVQCHYYELDEGFETHIHGVAFLPRDLQYKSMTIKGYSQKWKRIYDYQGWYNYITKDHEIIIHDDKPAPEHEIKLTKPLFTTNK